MMKKRYVIGFLIGLLCLLSAEAGGPKWHKLKALSDYPPAAFHLKENVAYMEIRWYRTKKSKTPYKTIAVYRTPLEKYPQNVTEKFKNLTPRYSNKADILPRYGNAFFIDTKGKMFRMDEVKDIVSLLGKIDRPAEAQLVLRLHNSEEGQYYRKIAGGYETKRNFVAKGCVGGKETVRIDGSSAFLPRDFVYSKRKCKQRKHTRFITSKTINYERYDAIALDHKGNVYLLGTAKKSKKSDEYDYEVRLDKYARNGKRLWSRKVKGLEEGIASGIAVDDRSVTILGSDKPLARYSLNGKRQSLSKSSVLKFHKQKDQKRVTGKSYLPEGLPDSKNGLDAEILASAKDKKGNTYIAGSELFYPYGSPDEVPDGMCGNVESVNGALVAKLDRNGKTIWARVIDGNE